MSLSQIPSHGKLAIILTTSIASPHTNTNTHIYTKLAMTNIHKRTNNTPCPKLLTKLPHKHTYRKEKNLEFSKL